MSDDAKIITAISEILSSVPASVEIIPGSVEQWQTDPAVPFLFVERHLGIPQKLLYRLYPVALNLFKESRLSSSHPALLNSSSVILLTNPAHQTALNQRKTLVLARYWSVEQELDFTSLLLSSSKEASKQSIIWDHRRWLFQTGYSKEADHDPDVKPIPASLLQQELDVILRSCEAYPRNYYAWTHWGFCVECLYTCCMGSNGGEYLAVISDAFHRLLRWIERHLSDYSAAYHLCKFVDIFHELESIRSLPDIDFTFARLSKQALYLVTRYSNHEALWMYLRAVWTAAKDWGLRSSLEASIAALPLSQYREQCISWCKQVEHISTDISLT